MTYTLNITAQARDDITQNAGWWAEHYSLEEALSWYDSVYQQLDDLLGQPEANPLAGESDNFPFELREKLVGGRKRTYRAIFTIVDTEVRVLTVRRAAQRAITSRDID